MPLTAFFCFFFFLDVLCHRCETHAETNSRPFSNGALLPYTPPHSQPQPITSKTCTPPQTCSPPLVPATDIDEPREIFIYVGLKTTSCGFFFFTPTMYTVVVLIIFQKVPTMVEVAGDEFPEINTVAVVDDAHQTQETCINVIHSTTMYCVKLWNSNNLTTVICLFFLFQLLSTVFKSINIVSEQKL